MAVFCRLSSNHKKGTGNAKVHFSLKFVFLSHLREPWQMLLELIALFEQKTLIRRSMIYESIWRNVFVVKFIGTNNNSSLKDGLQPSSLAASYYNFFILYVP